MFISIPTAVLDGCHTGLQFVISAYLLTLKKKNLIDDISETQRVKK